MKPDLITLNEELIAFRGEYDRQIMEMYHQSRSTITGLRFLKNGTVAEVLKAGEMIVEYAGVNRGDVQETIEAILAIRMLNEFLHSLTPFLYRLLDKDDIDDLRAEAMYFLGGLHSPVGQNTCRSSLMRIIESSTASDRLKRIARATIHLLNGDLDRYRQGLP